MQVFDIAIIGAGPAGATCALALRASGLRVALLDRAEFPRDKVCGDAIPARAVRVLREVAPPAANLLLHLPAKTLIQACKVIAPNGKEFTYHFSTPGYCARRLDFDGFLVEQVKAQTDAQLFLGAAVERIVRSGDGWQVETSSETIPARLIIGCDGANGITAKALGAFKLDPEHHCGAVRAYYDGVTGLQADTMEIHLLREGLPGYFWIFPLNERECNVGFGMLSHHIAAKKIALRTALPEMIARSTALKSRFAGAKMEGSVQGFGLPLGSRWVTMSGDGFMLCGDAASLIDPATGEGIGNAMWSAQVAARWAVAAFGRNDLGGGFLEGYSKELSSKLAGELRNKYLAQRLVGDRQGLLNWLIGRAGKPGLVNWLVRKVF